MDNERSDSVEVQYVLEYPLNITIYLILLLASSLGCTVVAHIKTMNNEHVSECEDRLMRPKKKKKGSGFMIFDVGFHYLKLNFSDLFVLFKCFMLLLSCFLLSVELRGDVLFKKQSTSEARRCRFVKKKYIFFKICLAFI